MSEDSFMVDETFTLNVFEDTKLPLKLEPAENHNAPQHGEDGSFNNNYIKAEPRNEQNATSQNTNESIKQEIKTEVDDGTIDLTKPDDDCFIIEEKIEVEQPEINPANTKDVEVLLTKEIKEEPPDSRVLTTSSINSIANNFCDNVNVQSNNSEIDQSNNIHNRDNTPAIKQENETADNVQDNVNVMSSNIDKNSSSTTQKQVSNESSVDLTPTNVKKENEYSTSEECEKSTTKPHLAKKTQNQTQKLYYKESGETSGYSSEKEEDPNPKDSVSSEILKLTKTGFAELTNLLVQIISEQNPEERMRITEELKKCLQQKQNQEKLLTSSNAIIDLTEDPTDVVNTMTTDRQELNKPNSKQDVEKSSKRTPDESNLKSFDTSSNASSSAEFQNSAMIGNLKRKLSEVFKANMPAKPSTQIVDSMKKLRRSSSSSEFQDAQNSNVRKKTPLVSLKKDLCEEKKVLERRSSSSEFQLPRVSASQKNPSKDSQKIRDPVIVSPAFGVSSSVASKKPRPMVSQDINSKIDALISSLKNDEQSFNNAKSEQIQGNSSSSSYTVQKHAHLNNPSSKRNASSICENNKKTVNTSTFIRLDGAQSSNTTKKEEKQKIDTKSSNSVNMAQNRDLHLDIRKPFHNVPSSSNTSRKIDEDNSAVRNNSLNRHPFQDVENQMKPSAFNLEIQPRSNFRSTSASHKNEALSSYTPTREEILKIIQITPIPRQQSEAIQKIDPKKIQLNRHIVSSVGKPSKSSASKQDSSLNIAENHQINLGNCASNTYGKYRNNFESHQNKVVVLNNVRAQTTQKVDLEVGISTNIVQNEPLDLHVASRQDAASHVSIKDPRILSRSIISRSRIEGNQIDFKAGLNQSSSAHTVSEKENSSSSSSKHEYVSNKNISATQGLFSNSPRKHENHNSGNVDRNLNEPFNRYRMEERRLTQNIHQLITNTANLQNHVTSVQHSGLDNSPQNVSDISRCKEIQKIDSNKCLNHNSSGPNQRSEIAATKDLEKTDSRSASKKCSSAKTVQNTSFTHKLVPNVQNVKSASAPRQSKTVNISMNSTGKLSTSNDYKNNSDKIDTPSKRHSIDQKYKKITTIVSTCRTENRNSFENANGNTSSILNLQEVTLTKLGQNRRPSVSTEKLDASPSRQQSPKSSPQHRIESRMTGKNATISQVISARPEEQSMKIAGNVQDKSKSEQRHLGKLQRNSTNSVQSSHISAGDSTRKINSLSKPISSKHSNLESGTEKRHIDGTQNSFSSVNRSGKFVNISSSMQIYAPQLNVQGSIEKKCEGITKQISLQQTSTSSSSRFGQNSAADASAQRQTIENKDERSKQLQDKSANFSSREYIQSVIGSNNHTDQKNSLSSKQDFSRSVAVDQRPQKRPTEEISSWSSQIKVPKTSSSNRLEKRQIDHNLSPSTQTSLGFQRHTSKQDLSTSERSSKLENTHIPQNIDKKSNQRNSNSSERTPLSEIRQSDSPDEDSLLRYMQYQLSEISASSKQSGVDSHSVPYDCESKLRIIQQCLHETIANNLTSASKNFGHTTYCRQSEGHQRSSSKFDNKLLSIERQLWEAIASMETSKLAYHGSASQQSSNIDKIEEITQNRHQAVSGDPPNLQNKNSETTEARLVESNPYDDAVRLQQAVCLYMQYKNMKIASGSQRKKNCQNRRPPQKSTESSNINVRKAASTSKQHSTSRNAFSLTKKYQKVPQEMKNKKETSTDSKKSQETAAQPQNFKSAEETVLKHKEHHPSADKGRNVSSSNQKSSGFCVRSGGKITNEAEPHRAQSLKRSSDHLEDNRSSPDKKMNVDLKELLYQSLAKMVESVFPPEAEKSKNVQCDQPKIVHQEKAPTNGCIEPQLLSMPRFNETCNTIHEFVIGLLNPGAGDSSSLPVRLGQFFGPRILQRLSEDRNEKTNDKQSREQ